jgi:glycosyltransferase involved in cell wall biosynthesis
MKTFSIIIPVLNPLKSLSSLLDQLKKFEEASTHFDLIVVNNFERYRELDFYDRYQSFFYRFTYLTIGFKSANTARNLGVRYSIGEFICFLDDDCMIDDLDYFKRYFDAFSKYQDTAGIGGSYRLPKNANSFDQAYHHIAMMWLESGVDPITRKTNNLIGGNCVYRKDVLKKGFGFDPAIAYGSSELSLNYQLCAHGHILRHLPELSVVHTPNLNLIDFVLKAYKQGRGSANQIFKQPPVQYVKRSMLLRLYNLFFHLGLISHGKSISVSQKLYRFLEFVQLVKFFNLAWVQVMRVYWNSLPFWGAIRWVLGHSYGLLVRLAYKILAVIHRIIAVIHKIIAFIGWIKKILVLLYWYLEPKVKFPFIKLYFMSEYHWETYLVPLLRRFGLKR